MKTILAIGAHPADVFDSAAGTLFCNSSYWGLDSVYVMSLTLGINSHTIDRYKRKARLDQIKELEFQDACEQIGAVPLWPITIDEPLMINTSNILELANEIKRLKPDIIITSHPNDYSHQDHAECGKSVMKAISVAERRGEDIHKVENIYFFATYFRGLNANLGADVIPPNILVDINYVKVMQAKIESMSKFKSQGYTKDYITRRMESYEVEMGRLQSMKYAEGFISYKAMVLKKLI